MKNELFREKIVKEYVKNKRIYISTEKILNSFNTTFTSNLTDNIPYII